MSPLLSALPRRSPYARPRCPGAPPYACLLFSKNPAPVPAAPPPPAPRLSPLPRTLRPHPPPPAPPYSCLLFSAQPASSALLRRLRRPASNPLPRARPSPSRFFKGACPVSALSPSFPARPRLQTTTFSSTRSINWRRAWDTGAWGDVSTKGCPSLYAPIVVIGSSGSCTTTGRPVASSRSRTVN